MTAHMPWSYAPVMAMCANHGDALTTHLWFVFAGIPTHALPTTSASRYVHFETQCLSLSAPCSQQCEWAAGLDLKGCVLCKKRFFLENAHKLIWPREWACLRIFLRSMFYNPFDQLQFPAWFASRVAYAFNILQPFHQSQFPAWLASTVECSPGIARFCDGQREK